MVTLGFTYVSCWSYSKRETGNHQQADMFILRERLLYYQDAVSEISLTVKRGIANEKEKAKIIRACHGCHYGRDKTRAKVSN